MALLLAAMGIYGVMSYSVEQRTHEIGIRSALGANRRDTLNLVLFQALRMTVAGLAVGIAAAFGLTRLLNAQLFGVKPLDPLTFTAVPVILLISHTKRRRCRRGEWRGRERCIGGPSFTP